MDARLLLSPLLGAAIATSILIGSVQAQFYPSAQMLMSQSMSIMPPPMPLRGVVMVPGSPMGFGPAAITNQAIQPGAWPAPSLPPPGAQGEPLAPPTSGRGQAVTHSENFIVFAQDQAWANQVSETAERLRRELAMHWLGKELPSWPARCPLHVHDGAALGASGETRFLVKSGMAGDWMMTVQGTRERILDSVLPHEISHTIFASHFGKLNKYVPRWADEGAATTVEHESEKKKHRYYLKKFLQSGRGLAFNEMFQLKEYPKDILPLYAQGHSAVQFLIDQAGPQHFVRFLEMGMRSEQWPQALAKHYDYASIWDFQREWNRWLFDGSPSDLTAYAPKLKKEREAAVTTASATMPSQTSVANVDNSSGNKGVSQFDSGTLPTDPRSLELTPSHQQADRLVGQVGNPGARPVMGEIGASVPFDSAPFDSVARNGTNENTIEHTTVGSESWFKAQLRQASGQSATPIPPHNNAERITSIEADTIPLGSQYSRQINNQQPANGRNDMVAINGTGLRSSQPPAGVLGSNTTDTTAPVTPPAAGLHSSGISTARQSGTQSPSVQVLQWGPTERISTDRHGTSIIR